MAACFLIAKATLEIHERLEGEHDHASPKGHPSFGAVIIQIMLLDIVFSPTRSSPPLAWRKTSRSWSPRWCCRSIMLFSAEPISEFVSRHPTIKVLALSFLLLIGISLVGDGLGMHVPKGYIYFAMGFSVFVEMINLQVRGSKAPVELR